MRGSRTPCTVQRDSLPSISLLWKGLSFGEMLSSESSTGQPREAPPPTSNADLIELPPAPSRALHLHTSGLAGNWGTTLTKFENFRPASDEPQTRERHIDRPPSHSLRQLTSHSPTSQQPCRPRRASSASARRRRPRLSPSARCDETFPLGQSPTLEQEERSKEEKYEGKGRRW